MKQLFRGNSLAVPYAVSAARRFGFTPNRSCMRLIMTPVARTSSKVLAGVGSTSTMMACSLSIK
jgi:hypothetical protein